MPARLSSDRTVKFTDLWGSQGVEVQPVCLNYVYIYKRSLVLQVQIYRRSLEAKGKEPKASSHALQLPEPVTCSLRKGAQWESALSLLSASWLALPVDLLGVWAWWVFSRVFGVLGGLGFWGVGGA